MINTDRIVTHEPRRATSPWNFDMDVAPRDGTRVLLAWEWRGNLHVDFFFHREDDFREWWDDDDNYLSVTPFAWAAINLPEVPK